MTDAFLGKADRSLQIDLPQCTVRAGVEPPPCSQSRDVSLSL